MSRVKTIKTNDWMIKGIPEEQLNYHARGFYCPTCLTGIENKKQKCPFCGQELLDAYGFDSK